MKFNHFDTNYKERIAENTISTKEDRTMARGVNKVTLIGHLGDDPEQRRTQNGGLVVNMSIATTDYWNDAETRERKEKTEWHRVVVFGKLADIAGQYLRKGSLVYIEGRLQTRKWEDTRSGQTRYTTEIVARELNMLDSRSSDNRPSADYDRSESDSQKPEAGGHSTASTAIADDPIEDIPW